MGSVDRVVVYGSSIFLKKLIPKTNVPDCSSVYGLSLSPQMVVSGPSINLMQVIMSYIFCFLACEIVNCKHAEMYVVYKWFSKAR